MVQAANEVAEEEGEVEENVEKTNITHEEDFFNKFGWQSTSLFPIKFGL
tara:strand:- start:849 stop:995 length:147 start_codon:yes stop_codon:yes gene_type:complete